MNLYLIYQSENDGWDTYDSAVVAAKTAQDAKETYPSEDFELELKDWPGSCWCSHPVKVTVVFIGKAAAGTEAGVICASFNAG